MQPFQTPTKEEFDSLTKEEQKALLSAAYSVLKMGGKIIDYHTRVKVFPSEREYIPIIVRDGLANLTMQLYVDQLVKMNEISMGDGCSEIRLDLDVVVIK